MSSVVISGDTSGAITLAAPAVAGTNTLTLQAGTATNSMNTLATAVASTSGTNIDFTSIPSWVKRITVMFNGVSLSGTAAPTILLGASGGFENTGYSGTYNWIAANANSVSALSSSFQITVTGNASSASYYGTIVFTNISGNIWIANGAFSRSDTTQMGSVVGGKTTSTTLDRLRIVASNGTDTFDAGSINILYEG
jgi:hypothetical protein